MSQVLHRTMLSGIDVGSIFGIIIRLTAHTISAISPPHQSCKMRCQFSSHTISERCLNGFPLVFGVSMNIRSMLFPSGCVPAIVKSFQDPCRAGKGASLSYVATYADEDYLAPQGNVPWQLQRAAEFCNVRYYRTSVLSYPSILADLHNLSLSTGAIRLHIIFS